MREIFARGSQIESGEFLLVEARFRNAGNFCLWKPDRIREIFACGSQIESGEFLLVEARFRNAGNFCLWKPDRIRGIFARGGFGIRFSAY